MNTVSRVQIADEIEDLFDGSAVERVDVLSYARTHGASHEVLVTLGRLQRDSYRALPDLWSELDDLPIEP